MYGMSSLLPAAEADTEEEGESGLDRLAYKKNYIIEIIECLGKEQALYLP